MGSGGRRGRGPASKGAYLRARTRKSDFFLPAPVGDLLSPHPRNPILRDASSLDLQGDITTDLCSSDVPPTVERASGLIPACIPALRFIH